jgi:hypothetical protein
MRRITMIVYECPNVRPRCVDDACTYTWMQLLLFRILASRNANPRSHRICSIKDRSYNFHVFARRWSGVEKIEPLVNISAIVAQLLVFNKHYIMNTFTIKKTNSWLYIWLLVRSSNFYKSSFSREISFRISKRWTLPSSFILLNRISTKLSVCCEIFNR